MTAIILVVIIIVLLIIAAVRKKKKSSNETVYYPPTEDNYTFQGKPSYPKTPVGPVSDSIVSVEAPISQSPITRQPVDSTNQALLMGQFLQNGKYRIIRMLGQGGFGITYLAEQTMMERKVCVKEFFMKEYCNRDGVTSQVSLGTQNNAAMMQKYQEKFLKEARMIARLDHPNIIRIHDVFAENNTAYYVMDYIEGKNLNEIVKERGALPEAVAVEYVRQIGEGLEFVHSHNINHLDIKPGNILIRKSNNRPILIDFGMSKQYNESGDQTSSTPVGVSAGYAPLEMYQAGGVTSFSPQTDVYELGATLYYLVTGTVPPSASNILNEGLTDIPRYLSPSIRIAIEQSMEPVRKNRPASVRDFLVLLCALKEDDVDDATVLI